MNRRIATDFLYTSFTSGALYERIELAPRLNEVVYRSLGRSAAARFASLSQATVVVICLDPKMNLRLRSKLFRELKLGARVLSNSFDMGDWKPDKVVKLSLAGSECVIYY